jgi:phage terminase large subunit-like protein
LNASKAMRGRYAVRLQSGDEHIKFSSGSMLMCVPTTDKAGHSKTLDMPIQDEAWALVDFRMDQALRPPMVTRPQPQFWIPSTAGHAGSLYLRKKVDEGRAAVEADTGRGTAYFEWSADEDADPEDPATWWSCMPALGFTQTEEAIQAELDGMRQQMPEFRRAYLNQWVDEIVESVIPLAWWRARHDPASRMDGKPVLVVDVSPDRSTAAIVAAGASTTRPGAVHIEIVNHGASTDWCVPRLLELWRRWEPRAIVFDGFGGAKTFEQPLRDAGVPEKTIVKASTGDLVTACGGIYDAARDGGVVHTGDPRLEAALRGAATRTLQDAWAWKRRTSTSDITPLVAATLAVWAHAEAVEGVVPWVAYG